MTVSLTVNMWHKMTKIEALLDCGATHNFIDPRTIKTLAMGTNQLKSPLLVHNVDGTVNQGGTITSYCNLWVLRYCRNVRPTWVKFDSKDTKESGVVRGSEYQVQEEDLDSF